jgi:hypothetical protein
LEGSGGAVSGGSAKSGIRSTFSACSHQAVKKAAT